MLATPLHALSCAAPTPGTSFRAAPGTVVEGRFAFDPAALAPRPGGDINAPVVAPVVAAFTGQRLLPEGAEDLSAPVTLDPVCLAAWCGAIPADTPLIALLDRQDDGWHLRLSPCPTTAFPPTDANRAAFRACLAGACPG